MKNEKINLFSINKQDLFYIICLVIFIIIVGAGIVQMLLFYGTKRLLTSMSSDEVILFKVYPRVIAPAGPPREFKPSAPIIDEFFQSIKDVRASWTNYSPADDEYVWFLEIITQKREVIQMSCTIPAKKGNIVIGMLNKHDFFKSRQLFHWYQKYSHLWLNPPESKQ